MNCKKVKGLRKQLGYHPRKKRRYERAGSKGPIELSAADPRYMYQQMKKELT